MNFLFQVQIIAKTELSEIDFRKDVAQVLSILDDICKIFGHNPNTPKYYPPGELIDAPDTWAIRYGAVLHSGASRHSALQSLMKSLQPLLDSLLPSCTLQWKTESLDFLLS